MEFNRLLSSAISAYGEPDFLSIKKENKIKLKKKSQLRKIIIN